MSFWGLKFTSKHWVGMHLFSVHIHPLVRGNPLIPLFEKKQKSEKRKKIKMEELDKSENKNNGIY